MRRDMLRLGGSVLVVAAAAILAGPGGICCTEQFSWDTAGGGACTGSVATYCREASTGIGDRYESGFVEAECHHTELRPGASFYQLPCDWEPQDGLEWRRFTVPLPGGQNICCFYNADDLSDAWDTSQQFTTLRCNGQDCPSEG